MIEKNITNEEYREREGISSSDVKAAVKSVAHWQGAEKKESTAFDLGTAYHEFVLEPENNNMKRGPENRLGKRWKEAKEVAELEGKLLLTSVDYDRAAMMANATMSQRKIASLVMAKDAMIEHSIFVTCKTTGLKLKTRPDCFVPSKNVCLDLKSTVDAGPGERDFASQIWKFNYDLQAAFYKYCCELAGLKVAYFCFAATEKVSPYATCLHVMSEEVMENAHLKMMRILKRMSEAIKENKYPTDWPEMNMIYLPDWMQKEEKE